MKNMFKKAFFVTALMALMTVLFCFGASALSSSGKCGDNVTWKYNSTTKELIISGKGEMYDYNDLDFESPFYSSDIKSVVIKSGVTTIGDSTFKSCNSLTSVTIPDSVTTIGSCAFYSCNSLTSVTIPDSVTTIGAGAFYWCDSLTSITVDKNNKYYCSDDYGVLFNKNKTELIQYPVGNTRTEYTIPDSVTTIGDYAFPSCDSLTSVTIGNSVTTIGDYAFRDCGSLTSVTIPDSVTTIGFYAFYYCDRLTSVTMGNSVTTIGSYAFSSCDRLTSVTIPDSVTTIGSNAFYGTAWYDNQPDGVVYAGKVAYKYKGTMPANTSITLKAGTKGVADSAFSSCYSLKSVTIPGSVTSIGEDAFLDCSGLKKVNITDMASWCKIDFADTCEEYINGVCYMNNSNPLNYADLYLNGKKVTDVIIPNGVTKIGHSAFYGYEDLVSITIPDSVNSIGYNAFENCKGLKSIYISDMAKWCQFDFYVSDLEYHDPGYMRSYSNPLTNADLYLNGKKVTELVIPDGVKKIGQGAFAGYKDLVSVTIPNSVNSIGFYAFKDCDGIKKVFISDLAKWCNFDFEVYYDYYFGDQTYNPLTNADLYLNRKKVTELVIPDGVKRIGQGVFLGCKGITSVVIPDSVKSVDFAAFYNCTSLKDVYYTGTQEQWKAIDIDTSPSNNLYDIINSNHYLVNAKIHYNYCGSTHKKIVNVAQQNPTCTKVGYTAGKQCSHCKEWISGHKKISATGHKYTPGFITKATLTANGKVIMKCFSCGDSYSKATYAVTTISLSSTKYIYDGTNKTPKVTVKDKKGNALVKGKDYKIAVASKRSGVGRYTVKVTLMGNYEGSKNLYFYILPGAPAAVKSAAQSSSAIKLSWSAVKGAVGYTVYRYIPSEYAYVKVVTTSQTSATAKSLSSGRKYIFKVVAYSKTSAGKVYYSEKYTLLKTATKTKTPSLTVTSPSKGEVALKWTNVSGETGYQIYYSTSKNGTYKKYTNCGVNTTNGSIYGLTSGKTYYFKIRTYIKTDSGYVYSPWSAVKGVKVK